MTNKMGTYDCWKYLPSTIPAFGSKSVVHINLKFLRTIQYYDVWKLLKLPLLSDK